MPSKLKALIFSLDGVAITQGTLDVDGRRHEAEWRLLMRFLVSKGIRPIVLANRPWTVTDTRTGKTKSAKEHYSPLWGSEVHWYVSQDDNFPAKPQAAAIEHVLGKEALTADEVVFLGNDDIDMKTAVNCGVLFLTAGWHPRAQPTEYGFRFNSARDVGRFVDLFCIRDHLWFYRVPEINLFSLGLVSSYDSTSSAYSDDAIETFKRKDPKHRDFWTKYLVSTLYFAGIHKQVDLIAPYPGHGVGHDNEVVRDSLITFAKCFRKSYCPDLIVRHTAAMKSQDARRRGITLDHRNQLNTIHLTRLPSKYGARRYKRSPFSKKRSVLVVDDFTTEGFGLDSARAYLRSIKNVQDVFLVSFLRFPRRDLHQLFPLPTVADPYAPNSFPRSLPTKVHGYNGGVVDTATNREIADHFRAYDAWDWPTGL